MNSKNFILIIAFCYLIIVNGYCDAHARRIVKESPKITNNENSDEKQFFSFLKSKEATPQGFIRLLIMRLIYGLAAQMGLEERLSGILNGVFVPPNADDDYGFDLGLGDDGGGGLFDAGDASDLFDFDL